MLIEFDEVRATQPPDGRIYESHDPPPEPEPPEPEPPEPEPPEPSGDRQPPG